MKSESSPPPTSHPPSPDAATQPPSASDTQTGDVWRDIRYRWQDNHATWFVAVALIIFCIGSATLAWRQRRSSRPEFPDASTLRPDPADVLAITESPTAVASSVRIEVVGASAETGPVRIAIYTNEQTFNEIDKAFWKGSGPVDSEGRAVIEVPAEAGLPQQFAIAAYHDTNNDGQLNRHPVGIPLERYGFSNGARATFGPPTFGEAVVIASDESSEVTVAIR